MRRAVVQFMKPLSTLVLWCLATTVSMLAAEPSADATPASPPAATILAGPWLLLGEDGQLRCGLEIAGALATADVHLRRGQTLVAAEVGLRPLQVANRPPAAVLEIVMPPGAGRWTVTIPGREVAITVATPPDLAEASRVVVAGPDNWPRAQDLAAFAGRAGGAAQLVVAYGLHSAAMLGSGGWEATVPVVILPHPVSPWILHAERIELIAAARMGGLSTHWRGGTRWGCLGLPWVADPIAAATTIARDLSPWEVSLAPSSWWELGLLAPRISRQASGTSTLIDLCQHLRVPLILTLGSGAGWISDPLIVDDDRVRSQAGGVRVIAATPAGDGLAVLPATVAAAIDDPGLIGLVADPSRLQVIGIGFSGADLLQLEFTRDGTGFIGSGAGRIGFEDLEVVTMRTAWLGDDEAGRTARARGRWLPMRELTTLHVEPADVLALLEVSEKVPAVIPLLRRLTGVEEVAATGLAEHLAVLPGVVQRDLLLRQLSRPSAFDPSPWMRVIATTADPLMLAAILRAYQDGGDPAMLELLVARVRSQASGDTPLETDALRQHRLMTAVFDATNLSPTVLRPLAVALKERLTPFTGGPVVRFLIRHGEVRKGN